MGPLSNESPKLFILTTRNPNPFFTDYKFEISNPYNELITKIHKPEVHNKPETKKYNVYEPKKIIYNGKATVVFWKDGTKTVVKMAEGTTYSKYNAFCAALAKKIFGSNSAVNRTVANGIEQK